MRQMVIAEQRADPAVPMRASVAASVSMDALSVGILVILVLICWAPRTVGPLDIRWDGATYYVLGTALAEGKGYRLLNEPGEIEAVQYPPLLPAMIAAHQLALGTSDPAIVGRVLRATFFVIYLAYVVGSYVLLRQFLPTLYAVGANFVLVLSVFTNFLSDLCFSEIPFGLAVVFFLVCNRIPGTLYGGLSAMFAVAAYLLRTIGIAVLVAWVGQAIVQRHYRVAFGRAILAMLPILAWHGYVHSVETSVGYQEPAYPYQRAEYAFYNVSYSRNVSLRDPFSPESGRITLPELATRFLVNLPNMWITLAESVTANGGHWKMRLGMLVEPVRTWPGVWRIPNHGATIILAILGLLVIGGMVALLRDGEVLIPSIFALVFVAISLTPWPSQWPRYWTPLFPLLVLSLFYALRTVCRWASTKARGFSFVRVLVTALVVLVIAVQALTLEWTYATQMSEAIYTDRHGRVLSYRLFFYKEEGFDAMDAGLDWLKAHAPSEAIVAASMPTWIYLRTGLKAVMPPFHHDLDAMQALLDAVPVRYVIVDTSPIKFVRHYTLPLLKNSPRWSRVYVDNRASGRDAEVLEIYERVGPGPNAAPSGGTLP